MLEPCKVLALGRRCKIEMPRHLQNDEVLGDWAKTEMLKCRFA